MMGSSSGSGVGLGSALWAVGAIQASSVGSGAPVVRSSELPMDEMMAIITAMTSTTTTPPRMSACFVIFRVGIS